MLRIIQISLFLICFAVVANDCPSLLSRIESSEQKDWVFNHGSTLSIVIGNAAILTGTEGLRTISGQPSFNADFVLNSGIDMSMTLLAHQVALIPIPWIIKKRLSRWGEFFLRAGTNTMVDFAVLLTAWKAAAASRGVVIDSPEKWGAFVFCLATYFTLQMYRDFAFVNYPLRQDAKLVTKLIGEAFHFRTVIDLAKEKGRLLGLPPAEVERLVMTFIEHVIIKIPFENRMQEYPEIVQAVNWKKHDSIKARWDLLEGLIKLSKERPELKNQIGKIVFLGDPMTQDESLNIISHWLERVHVRRRTVRWAAGIDRILGGVIAGGLVMRQMTAGALAD